MDHPTPKVERESPGRGLFPPGNRQRNRQSFGDRRFDLFVRVVATVSILTTRQFARNLLDKFKECDIYRDLLVNLSSRISLTSCLEYRHSRVTVQSNVSCS